MRKLKNTTGNYHLFLHKGIQYDFQPGQEVLVPDGFKEWLISQLDRFEYSEAPPKMVMGAFGKRMEALEGEISKPVSVVERYTREELERMSFKQLRSIGYKQNPVIRGKSKKELVEELLSAGVEK